MDNLTIEQRSYCMSRVRNRDTGLERVICNELRKRKLKFKKQAKHLPGSPDVVFVKEKLAVFIDGDFWHGYRFPSWEKTVSKFWRDKITLNRKRDSKNFSKLRKSGWKVMRFWQHDVKKNPHRIIVKIHSYVSERKIEYVQKITEGDDRGRN